MDLSSYKVRNGWVLMAVIIGFMLRGPAFLPGAAAALAAGFWLFHLRMMGAGDGKVMMVIAGYLGLRDGSRAIAAGFLAGAVWSLCRLWHDRSFRARLEFLFAYFVRIFQEKEWIMYDSLSGGDGRHRIPLAACLSAGTGLYLLGIWAAG